MAAKLISQKQLYILFAALAVIAGAIVWLSFDPNAKHEDPSAKAMAATSLPLPSPADLAATYGGLSPNAEQQGLVTRVGEHLATSGDVVKLGRSFRFYLLADQNRANSFALPDGSIFITTLLLNHLKTEGQLAAILARDIAHVTARATPNYQVTGKLIFTPDQTKAADLYGVHYMAQAGYDPRALSDVLVMLGTLNASTPIEFFATHPADADRAERIDAAIKQEYPEGVPSGLSK